MARTNSDDNVRAGFPCVSSGNANRSSIGSRTSGYSIRVILVTGLKKVEGSASTVNTAPGPNPKPNHEKSDCRRRNRAQQTEFGIRPLQPHHPEANPKLQPVVGRRAVPFLPSASLRGSAAELEHQY